MLQSTFFAFEFEALKFTFSCALRWVSDNSAYLKYKSLSLSSSEDALMLAVNVDAEIFQALRLCFCARSALLCYLKSEEITSR